VKLVEVCEIVRGSSPRPKSDPRFYGGPVPRLMVADLTRDGKLVSALIDSLTELGAKQSRPMRQGDLVIAVSGAPGLPAILAHDACIHDGFVGLRDLDRKHVDAGFLYAYLTFVRATSNGKAVGAIFKNLTTDQIKDIEIPDLPLAEQRWISGVLERAEALRAKRRASLAQLDSLTQALFLHSFVANNQFPPESLNSVCELITDGTHYTPTYSETGIVFLSSRNVTSGYVDWSDVKFIPESLHTELHRRVAPQINDILLAKNGTTGIAAIVDRDCVFDIYVSLALLRPSGRVLPIFLQQAVNSPACTRQFNASLKGIGVPNLHLKEIRQTKIPVPPIGLQREFARRVRAVEKLKAAQRASLAELNALFAALQHRAFNGELFREKDRKSLVA
jgi:type I restriction enzyme S subunit